MKRILSLLFPALMVVLMLSACGSSDQIQPVLYDLFDTYPTPLFHNRRGVIILEHQMLPGHMIPGQMLQQLLTTGQFKLTGQLLSGLQLTASSSDLSVTQNSAFLNSGCINKTDVDCRGFSTRMLIAIADNINDCNWA